MTFLETFTDTPKATTKIVEKPLVSIYDLFSWKTRSLYNLFLSSEQIVIPTIKYSKIIFRAIPKQFRIFREEGASRHRCSNTSAISARLMSSVNGWFIKFSSRMSLRRIVREIEKIRGKDVRVGKISVIVILVKLF